MEENIYL